MADSFQSEIPKARVNIRLDLHTGGAQKKLNFPLNFSPLVISATAKQKARFQSERKLTLTKTISTVCWLN